MGGSTGDRLHRTRLPARQASWPAPSRRRVWSQVTAGPGYAFIPSTIAVAGARP